ncbi:CHAT domain-containing tetratricopeptide repeat protein [Archangium violaceum]|uniref:CHAT domain-containing tetratricopeptide repeat protein n=1 Tax=Archangium violaceum TaxID=83451 RepID=UPI0036DE644D
MNAQEVADLNRRVSRLLSVGRHSDALRMAEEGLAAVQKTWGPSHPATALQLQVLASALREAGDAERARTLLLESLAIRKAALGERHPVVAATLRDLAILAQNQHDFARAQDFYDEARKRFRAAFPADHEFVKRAEGDLQTLAKARLEAPSIPEGLAVYQRGQQARERLEFDAAQEELTRAVELNRAQRGHAHSDVAICLIGLAGVLRERGSPRDAIPLLREALHISRTHPEDPHRVQALSELGMTLGRVGELAEARALHDEAAALARSGSDVNQLLLVLNNQATSLRESGHAAESATLLDECISLMDAQVGPERLKGAHQAAVLNNRASIANDSGNYHKAIELYLRTLELKERTLGRRHPSYARTVLNLARMYFNVGDKVRGQAYSEEALATLRETLGEEHPDTAEAAMEAARGDGPESAAHAQEAIAILEKHPGAEARLASARLRLAFLQGNRVDLKERLFELAELKRQKHPEGTFPSLEAEVVCGNLLLTQALGQTGPDRVARLAAAETYLQRAESLLSNKSFDRSLLADCLLDLAKIDAATGRLEAAMAKMERAMSAKAVQTHQAFSITSERLRLSHAESLTHYIDLQLALIERMQVKTGPLLERAVHHVLMWKNAVVDLALGEIGLFRRTDSPEQRELLLRLFDVKAKLASRVLSGPGVQAASLHKDLDAWGREREELEAEIARHIGPRDLPHSSFDVSPDAVRHQLEADDALIEFIVGDDFPSVFPNEGSTPAQHVYRALLIRKEGPVSLIRLGSAEEIEQQVAKFLEHVSQTPTSAVENPITQIVSRRLQRLLLAPLLPHLKGTKRLFIAPDGELWHVPFEVLPLPTAGLFVIDAYEVCYLSCGRDLVRPAAEAASGRPVVIADPDFDLESNEGVSLSDDYAQQSLMLATQESMSSFPMFIKEPDSALEAAGLNLYTRLPGTRAEGEWLADSLDAVALFGADATKDAFRRISSPRMLHIATHGFFLDSANEWITLNAMRLRAAHEWAMDEQLAMAEHFRSMMSSQLRRLLPPGDENSQGLGHELPEIAREALKNPMLASGLVLAGANTWLRRGRLHHEAWDGHVTAEEVSAMDLAGTELVVLSSCDSGRGTPKAQSGIFGLRRAFVLAGAKSLVTTLWPISDEHTHHLMKLFYEQLAVGLSPSQALRESKLAMRQAFGSAFYWGAFVYQAANMPLTPRKGT